MACFRQIPKFATIKTITRLSWDLLSHMKTVLFVNFVTLAVAMFHLFLSDSFTAMFAFWFTGCDFEGTYFSGYNMFPFSNGLILHKNTRCLEVILFVFSNFITE